MAESSRIQIRQYDSMDMHNWKRCNTCHMYEHSVRFREDWGDTLCSTCYRHAINGTYNPHDLNVLTFQYFQELKQLNSEEE